jgi:hypothetical protein
VRTLNESDHIVSGVCPAEAAIYAGHPWALQLRAMNIIYETTKERGATILMPSSMVDSLNPSAATLGFAVAGNDTLANNLALAGRGVQAANGALEPDGLPHPAAA